MSEDVSRSGPGRVAVLAPSGRDSEMIREALLRAGIEAVVCGSLEALCLQVRRSDAGVLAEEALHEPRALGILAKALAAQPPWSDLPLIVLGIPHRSSAIELFTRLSGFANVTLLERPTRSFTLVTVVRAALRARGRQHLTREYMEELVAARERLARHRDELQEAVTKRTEELQTTSSLLRLSERMASIGTLAAGLGHDLANLLLPMRIDLDGLERDADEGARERIARVRRSLDYVGKLAASMRLLALDPDGVSAEEPATDIAEWWEGISPLLQLAVRRDVRLEASLTPGLAVRLAPHRLTQAVLNLVSNACDAIRARGGEGMVRVEAIPAPGGAGALVRVSDDGPGMTEEVTRRCLEPMFTTGTHRGATGLGLSLVDGIVRAAGGRIEIDSRVGEGTSVTLVLPASPASAEGKTPLPVAVISLEDARLRSLLGALLGRRGYSVEGRLREDAAPALWFTEATESAASIAARLRARWPGVRIVVVGEPTAAWSGLGVRALDRGAPVSALESVIRADAADSRARCDATTG